MAVFFLTWYAFMCCQTGRREVQAAEQSLGGRVLSAAAKGVSTLTSGSNFIDSFCCFLTERVHAVFGVCLLSSRVGLLQGPLPSALELRACAFFCFMHVWVCVTGCVSVCVACVPLYILGIPSLAR